MSHMIEKSDGAAFRNVAWHGLGVVFDRYMTFEEAFEAAGLGGWGIHTAPLYTTIDGELHLVPDRMAIVRRDTSTVLGTCGKDYHPVQNEELIEVMKAFPNVESAFSIMGGKRVILLSKIDTTEIVDEKHDMYCLGSIGHDGTSGITVGPTDVRVVCWNTFRLAQQRSSLYTVSHRGEVEVNLKMVQRALDDVVEHFHDFAQYAEKLVMTRMTLDDVLKKYQHMFIPEDASDKRIKREIDMLASFWDEESAIQPSAWRAFNAVTALVDHRPRRGRTDFDRRMTRFRQALLAEGQRVKQKWFDALLQQA